MSDLPDLKPYVDQLEALDNDDPETAHKEADRILLEALDTLGAGVVAEAYMNTRLEIGFWYA